MPVAYQDLYLLLRAENLASAAITGVGNTVSLLGKKGELTAAQLSTIGSGLISAGTVVTALGAVGLDFWYKAGKAAAQYAQQVAYTATQTQGLHISQKQLSAIGLDVMGKYPVAWDSIQTGMYNIVSTVKVNYATLKQLTSDFAKAAVAGQSDISTASKTTIGELHAFNLPISDTNKLLNQQFEMVKQGRGTYSEFISAIGTAIPVYAANNQSIAEMNANIAFLTRNGASVSAATAAAARAVEAMSKKEFATGLNNLGISFTNAAGKAKPLDVIVNEIAHSAKWQAIVKQSGSIGQAFVNTFGLGTIQARRFFDLALKDTPQLNTILKNQANPKGALARAYAIEMSTPINQLHLLGNQLKRLQIEFGENLLPILKPLVHYVKDFVDWLGRLSPHTQKIIALVGAFGSLFALFGGAGMLALGFGLKTLAALMAVMDVGTLGELGGALGEAAAAAAPFAAAIVGIGVALFVIIKYHKQIWEWMQKAWHDSLAWIEHWRPLLDEIGQKFVDLGHYAKEGWGAVVKAAKEAFDFIMRPIHDVATFFTTTWDAVFNWWNTNWPEVSGVFEEVWSIITGIIHVVMPIISTVIKTYLNIISAEWSFVWRVLATTVKVAFRLITDIIKGAFDVLSPLIKAGWGVIENVFKIAWDTISFVVKTAWDIIAGVIKTGWTIIEGLFTVALDLLTGHWSKAWDDIKHYATQVWHDVYDMIMSVGNNIIGYLTQLASHLWSIMFGVGAGIIKALWAGIQSVWHIVRDFFTGLMTVIVNFFAGAWNMMYKIGTEIIKGLISGVKDAWRTLKGGVSDVYHGMLHDIKSFFGIASPSLVYWNIGKSMMEGLANGLTANANLVKNAHNNIIKSLPGIASRNFSWAGNETSLARAQHIQLVNITMPKGMITITVSSALTAADQQNLEKITEKALDDFSDKMLNKVKKVKVS